MVGRENGGREKGREMGEGDGGGGARGARETSEAE